MNQHVILGCAHHIKSCIQVYRICMYIIGLYENYTIYKIFKISKVNNLIIVL